jgi:hypothetical protein
MRPNAVAFLSFHIRSKCSIKHWSRNNSLHFALFLDTKGTAANIPSAADSSILSREILAPLALGLRHLPSLIVCGKHSLIKLNGHPYGLRMQGDAWMIYAFPPRIR